MNSHSLSALGWRLSELARCRPKRLLVYITPDLRSYRTLAEELSFFLPQADHLWRFPAWEVLPYDRVSPHHAIVGERFATLSRLLRQPNPSGVLITALPAWLQRIAPPSSVTAHVWQLKVGDQLDLGALQHQLIEAGMQPVERVMDSGEFAVRGGLFDIWPATSNAPIRIDLFGDDIDSIHTFDIDSQRSGAAITAFVSVPVREVILDQPGRETFCAAFRARFPHLRGHPMLTAAKVGRPHPGIEALLPLAYHQTARLQDYLPSDAVIVSSSDLLPQRDQFGAQLRSHFDLMRHTEDPAISPQELFAVESDIRATLITQQEAQLHLPPVGAAPALSDFSQRQAPLHALRDRLRQQLSDGWRLLLIAHGPGQAERMREVCAPLECAFADCAGLHDLPDARSASGPTIFQTLGFVEQGFVLEHDKLLVLTGRELLGQRISGSRHRSISAIRANVFQQLQELVPGNMVIHEDHGLGRYCGLETMEVEPGQQADFLHIEYAGDASIFVPVEELARLHPYVGDSNPALNKLGSDKWKKTRQRVETDLLVIAHELVAVEARRRQVRHEVVDLAAIRDAYDEFCARFPFEETEDQQQAIDQVLADMQQPLPMDRVVCGDVGFGKTEVAMRAAFVAAADGRQVAMLAPTTVLANQHYTSLRERFAGTGLEIALLSRLQGKAESARIITGLQLGTVQIIVGTHRLLSAAIKFSNLGLVIVDEEHRFGVKHKEAMKKLHASVDLMTMTATPIPRTLHQTLSGLRSVSIISTPPSEREAIRTIVCQFDLHLAAEAIRRELYRGGQVYYLHNHVKSIDRVAQRLREQVPEAEIGIAHGQMGAAVLDRAMMAFHEGRLHILVCTTIVESGLDVPNANTMIVERADLLGLAQLHQIRGRVGRSHRQAFAYLFTPDPRAITPDARERLHAIAQHSELGAGFMLARQDMEIRGAGNLLGAEQSGKISAIGLDLYLEMLGAAISEARDEPVETRVVPCEIHHPFNAILTPDYIPQMGERLALYRRISRIHFDEEADGLLDEISDRFGTAPAQVLLCLTLARLRWRATALRIRRIDMGPKQVVFSFTIASPIDSRQLMQQVQSNPRRFALRPDGALTLRFDREDAAAQQIAACVDFLSPLLEHPSV
ncbi:MAG: transcription-repair coupling factor [Mariprofundales bacterium]|nr:transcription-repair coupling factor [Mariprofundales bacterium]